MTQTNVSRPFHVMTKPIGPICNLNCEYCFYLEKEQLYPDTPSIKMNDEVLEEYTRQYIQRQPPGTGEINFAWQGGEPTLMEIEYFKRALTFQQKYARPGMNIWNSIQTNGTRLNNEWGKFLSENSFLVGLSVDGPKDIHNRFRIDKRGRGSFEKVLQGLEILKKFDVEFNTLTCVQCENGDQPEKIYNFLKEIGSTFMQFIPVVEPVRGKRVGNRSVAPLQYGKFLIGVFNEWLQQKDVGSIFVRDFDVTLSLVMGLPSPICVHAETCGYSIALEHNGDMYSCDHFVDPEYHIGNVLEADLSEMIESDFQQKFGRNKCDGLPKFCRKCEFLHVCHGGCPKDRILHTHDGEPGLNYLCEGYKKFYRHSIPIFRKMAECLRMGVPASGYYRLDQLKKVPREVQDPAVGRNDSCYCGSGKKFKYCCGA